MADSRVGNQMRLDLVQLNTESSYFDLEVLSAEKFDFAVGSGNVPGRRSCKVAGFRHLQTDFRRIFRGQFCLAQVASGQSGAPNVQLTRNARVPLKMTVENMKLRVRNRSANCR